MLRAGSASDRPPLLFIHGSFCGAWVWREYFLPHFAERGWWCHALSLRGHGGSDGGLDRWGVEDFLADMAQAVRDLPGPPVVIGHSLGGMLAQRFACRHPCAGMVLLGSLGPNGLAPSLAHMAAWHPDLLAQIVTLQVLGPRAVDAEIVRRGLFSADFPSDRARRYLPAFQRESQRAAWELMMPQWPFLALRPSLPALAIVGSQDPFIPWSEFAATVALWRAQSAFLDDVPHLMMLDTTWRRVAEHVEAWLVRLAA